MPGSHFNILIAVLSLFLGNSAFASDWPQLLGPTRDAVYSGPALNMEWPKEGPAVLWSKEVGHGYSSPVIASGKIVQCHRLGDHMVVSCFELLTGKSLWEIKHPMKFQEGAEFDSGPQTT